VLTTGGHNAGIVSEPGHPHRSYRMTKHRLGEHHLDAETWRAAATVREGSWWPEWAAFLATQSSEPEPPPPIGAVERGLPPLVAAPGTYVMTP
jgi:polyhydroxyalkanoate synthase